MVLIMGCVLTGCSRSRRILDAQQNRIPGNTSYSGRTGVITVAFERRNGVLFVPVEVNGMKMDFIFDTGASDVSISAAEAIVMVKQGTLRSEHIHGNNQFTDATGNVSVGTIITLEEIKIGGHSFRNVEATVVDNMAAPLLLGQSFLQRFGKVQIDYSKNILTIH
jgi:aspartyl protease family protein